MVQDAVREVLVDAVFATDLLEEAAGLQRPIAVCLRHAAGSTSGGRRLSSVAGTTSKRAGSEGVARSDTVSGRWVAKSPGGWTKRSVTLWKSGGVQRM